MKAAVGRKDDENSVYDRRTRRSDACISFTDQYEQYFMVGNIAGRGSVNAELDPVRRMMDWVAETDRRLIEYTGLGKDNVPYFRLGYDARQIMKNGGFHKYFRGRQVRERLEHVRMWAPICISLLALVVAFLAFMKK